MRTMERWIKVHGKKMDSVEFARFIRDRTTHKIDRELKRQRKF